MTCLLFLFLYIGSLLVWMLILLCVMLCDMSLISVSIYRFSLGVDVDSSVCHVM